MIWLLSVLLYLHILGAIFWFGSSLFMQVFMVPALRAMQFEAQKPWMMAITGRYGRVVGPLAGLTILLGLLRGIAAGVLGHLGTPYGLTFLASIVVAAYVGVMGGRFIGPTAEKMAASTTPQGVLTGLGQISRYGRFEIGGFLVVLALMVAMGAGY